MPSYTLYAPEGSFRAFAALIAAEYNGIEVKVETDLKDIPSLSPTGKAPILVVGGKDVIFSSHAIARYLGGMRRDTLLSGSSLQDMAAVDSWMDFCAHELELPACVWYYPVAEYMPFNAEAYAKAKVDLGNALKIMEDYLLTKTYLVGDSITLADIMVASTLLYPFKLVADKTYLKPYGNVQRWFNTCVNQPEFISVVGKVQLCKKEALAAGQTAAKSGGDKKASGDNKKEAKKEKAEPAEPAPAPEKKAEHPYKIMDKDSPSAFSMDAWKKTYSNAKTYEEAMDVFWQTFDQEGWSLWFQNYNYNEENKRIFMTANAVGGFQQRSDEIRRWAFGIMDVLGTEEEGLEIKGIWLLRGDTVEHMVNANDDANWYTWTKLAGKGLAPTEEVKALVAAYWCSENELEGKPIQDSKVFK